MREQVKSKVEVVRVEHMDDVPVLLSSMKQMGLVALLDRHFTTHPLWKGELSFGEVVAGWITHLVSEGDHRLNHVQPWAQLNHDTLQACLGKTVRDLDFHDDRLADVLDDLADEQRWQSFESDLNGNTIRVYKLKPQRFRIDTTTASSYAKNRDDEAIIQFGHSKDNDKLPQLKVAATVLDPLGLPVTTVALPGNVADDTIYVSQIQRVNSTFGEGKKTFFGDCKMGALNTRAVIASTKDWYVCPLSEVQLSAEQRLGLLEGVFNGTQTLKPVCRPAKKPKQPPELIAEGFSYDVVLSAVVGKRRVRWTERRWMVRSVANAKAKEEKLDQRLAKAISQLEQLAIRKQGKKRLNAQQMEAAATAIIANNDVVGLLVASVRTTTTEHVRRRCGPTQEQTHQVEVVRQEQAIVRAKQELGWQVYATNNRKLSLVAVVLGYRGQYQIEDYWSRMKGRSLSLSPMYLAIDSRLKGLVNLLSLAVRVLSVLEWVVRRKLKETGKQLTGVHPAQAGRKTSRPSAELLLRVFRGISLTVVKVGDRVTRHVTPLTSIQQQLLELWDFPKNLFQRVALHCPKPPPAISER